MGTEPGWYRSDHDPDGTERYWDGAQWVGAPRVVPGYGGPGQVHGQTLATPASRIIAVLVDVVVVTLLMIPAYLSLLVQLDFDLLASGEMTATEVSMDTGWVVYSLIVASAYHIIMVGLFGATVGKLATSIRVVRAADGVSPPGIVTATRRYSVMLALDVLGLAAALATLASFGKWAIWITSLILVFQHPLRRSVFDLVGDTYVVTKTASVPIPRV